MRQTLFSMILALACVPLRADVAGAKAAFYRGLGLERAKSYPEAIKAYQSALVAEPRYAWADRQMGNCFYYLGDKAEALRHYDAYLALVGNDVKTRAFADRLRAELDGAVPAATAAVEPAPMERWLVHPRIGVHTLAFKDWNDYFKGAVSIADIKYPIVTVAYSVGVDVGFRLTRSMDLGLDADFYYVATELNTKFINVLYNFSVLWIGPQFTYSYQMPHNPIVLDLGVGMGYLTLVGAGATSAIVSGYEGTGLGYRGTVGFGWRLNSGHAIMLDVGYRSATVPSVKVANGSGVGGTLKKVDGSGDLVLDYSGLDLKLGMKGYF